MLRNKIILLLVFIIITNVGAGAGEWNSVEPEHPAYGIIEAGVLRGIVPSPPPVKPWSKAVIKETLRSMLDAPAGTLHAAEADAVREILASFERETGFNAREGRYRAKKGGVTAEIGIGWGTGFSLDFLGTLPAVYSAAELYALGDLGAAVSWNVTAAGGFVFAERGGQDHSSRSFHDIPSVLPYSFNKWWDGGVFSPDGNAGWPDEPSLAGTIIGEVNAAFSGGSLLLRAGRIRREWGAGQNGSSLFINTAALPFPALELTASPLPWLRVAGLTGALEHGLPGGGPFANVLSAAMIEISHPKNYVYFNMGGSAVFLQQFNGAVFAGLGLRLPGVLSLWGNVFVDKLNSLATNFSYMNSNSFAYQGGVRAAVRWFPFGFFTARYTKTEPYCYTSGRLGEGADSVSASNGFSSGGESLGLYLPPNSDEFLLRLEAGPLPGLTVHIQYQLIRNGTDYGYGAVSGSSLNDIQVDDNAMKYFLMDGVYRWDNIIRLGAAFRFKTGKVPISVYAETGFTAKRFTINGTSGVGAEADYAPLDDSVYRAANNVIFSAGFRLFSGS